MEGHDQDLAALHPDVEETVRLVRQHPERLWDLDGPVVGHVRQATRIAPLSMLGAFEAPRRFCQPLDARCLNGRAGAGGARPGISHGAELPAGYPGRRSLAAHGSVRAQQRHGGCTRERSAASIESGGISQPGMGPTTAFQPWTVHRGDHHPRVRHRGRLVGVTLFRRDMLVLHLQQ